MEINDQDPAPSFNSPNSAEQEIRIAISSTEESMRKLYEATKKGCIESLKILMEDDPFLIQKVVTYNDSTNNNNNYEKDPLLHLSISNGHLEFTRLLLRYHPQLSGEVDSFKRTPLHLASKLGHIEIVEALLEKNMSACFVYDNNDFIPLHYAILSRETDIMLELIKARPRSLWMNLNNGQTVLHLCVESNNLEGMKLLIESFINRDEDFLNTVDDEGYTILDLSIKLRQSEMVGYLLSNQKIKTRTNIISNLTTSNTKKEDLNFQKVEARNPERQKNEIASWSTKTMRGSYNRGWVEEVQGTMMLVATVIATVTFQAGINPPGGVWQQDTQFNSNIISNQNGPLNYTRHGSLLENVPWKKLYTGVPNGTVFFAGTAIFAYELPISYLGYSIANMVSFLASVSVILLIISRVPLKSIVCSWLLVLSMCAAVVFLAFGFLTGFAMVNGYTLDHFSLNISYLGTFLFIVGLVGLVLLVHVIRFLVWLVKSVFWILTPKLKSHNFN